MCFIKKKSVNKLPLLNSNELLAAIGGSDNYLSHTVNGSRLYLELKDYSKINKDALNHLGVKNIIMMTNKAILLLDKQLINNFDQVLKNGL